MTIRATSVTSAAIPTNAAIDASAAKPAAAADDAASAKAANLHKAASEFESMLVRQLLTAAHMGGNKQDAYSGMAVDALASGIERGGGLGLTRQIEDAIAR